MLNQHLSAIKSRKASKTSFVWEHFVGLNTSEHFCRGILIFSSSFYETTPPLHTLKIYSEIKIHSDGGGSIETSLLNFILAWMEQNKVLKKTFCSVFSPSLLRKFWEKSSFYKRANSLSQRAPLILYSPQSQPTHSPLQNVQIWKRQGCWQHKKTAILRQLFQHWWNKEFSETFSWDSMKILKNEESRKMCYLWSWKNLKNCDCEDHLGFYKYQMWSSLPFWKMQLRT